MKLKKKKTSTVLWKLLKADRTQMDQESGKQKLGAGGGTGIPTHHCVYRTHMHISNLHSYTSIYLHIYTHTHIYTYKYIYIYTWHNLWAKLGKCVMGFIILQNDYNS